MPLSVEEMLADARKLNFEAAERPAGRCRRRTSSRSTRRSVTEMLGENGGALTFLLCFDQEDAALVQFEIGGTTLSPLESFDHDEAAVEAACSFVRLPDELQPPYAKGARMHVLVRRASREFFELSFKLEKMRSPVFRIRCAPGRDFLAVRTPALKQVLAGNVDFKNLAEYLAAFEAAGQRAGKCCVCLERDSMVVYHTCKHVVYCVECNLENSKCPVCKQESAHSLTARFRSPLCMGCAHKQCTEVGALFWPCACMVACWPSGERLVRCPHCDVPIRRRCQVFIA
ncbi:hypothetical protein M3Y99_00131100 [Aphelenchoides fujianensis]|nr:hypothetical protein M3Y99_00131100 [Aphelenchoides fujianensis]